MRYALLVLLVAAGIGCSAVQKDNCCEDNKPKKALTPLGHDPDAISPGGCPWKCCEVDGVMPCTTNCCTPNDCPCPHAPKPS